MGGLLQMVQQGRTGQLPITTMPLDADSQTNILVLTLYSAVASDGYISKCSVPSSSNLHF